MEGSIDRHLSGILSSLSHLVETLPGHASPGESTETTLKTTLRAYQDSLQSSLSTDHLIRHIQSLVSLVSRISDSQLLQDLDLSSTILARQRVVQSQLNNHSETISHLEKELEMSVNEINAVLYS
jgi:hypothetical protein